MTVTSGTPNRVQESGNGVKTSFDFAWKIFNSSEIEVYKVDTTTDVATLQTITADYTVVFDTEAGTGTVTYTVAPLITEQSLIISNFAITQETDIPTASNFPEVSIENGLDKLTLLVNQNQEQLNRGIRLPVQSQLSGLSIPVSAANADKLVSINSAGDNFDVLDVETLGGVVISDYGKSLIVANDANDARNILNSQEDVINTRGDIIRGNSSGAVERLPIGNLGQILTSDGLDVIWSDQQSLPIGSVLSYTSSTVPSGFLECDGSAISRTTYASLFAIVGTTWGIGDGSTTFNIPDLRGEFVRGWDNGRGVDSGRAFASSQADDFASHRHGIQQGAGTTGSLGLLSNDSLGFRPEACDFEGGDETRPKNIAMMYIIKY